MKLEILNTAGRNVGAGLKPAPTAGQWYPPGTHQILFDGAGLPSGIYIYRLTVEEFTGSGKMVLMK